MDEPHDRWEEQLRKALRERAGAIEDVTPWAPPTTDPRVGRHPWTWLTPLAAVAAVLLVVIGVAATRLGADHAVRPASPSPTAPPTGASSLPNASSPPVKASTAPSTSSPAPGTPPDVFAEITGGSGSLVLISAVTGKVVRTLVPAADLAGDSAEVGPSGRYVYFTDGSGAARVPVGGGRVQPLADLSRRDGGGNVVAVFADRTDTQFLETIGYDDDSKPLAVYVAKLDSSALAYLGSKLAAVGWDPTGTTAYVTSAYGITGITGISAAAPHTHVFQKTLSCAVAAAIGPSGQMGWTTLRGDCASVTARRATYAIDSDGHEALFTAPGPTNQQPVDYRLQYTPAGTAVLVGYGYLCRGTYPTWVVRTGSSHPVEFPGVDPQCA